MTQLLLDRVQEHSNSLKKSKPKVRVGDRVKVHQKILESTKDGMKERLQIFEGLVIAMSSGRGTDATFTVRKISFGVGVEKVFLLHSKNVSKIETVGSSKVTRAKLYFMRGRSGKGARLKEGREFLEVVTVGEPIPEPTPEMVEEAIEAAKKLEEAEHQTEEEPAVPQSDASSPDESSEEVGKAEAQVEEEAKSN